MSVVSTMNAKRATDEVRYANDELEHFYLEAKRNKKVANWAAKKLGLDKKEYFLELISADLTSAGPKPVIDRILSDFEKAGLGIAQEKVWEKLREFESQILGEMLLAQAKRTKAEMKAKEKKNKKKKKK